MNMRKTAVFVILFAVLFQINVYATAATNSDGTFVKYLYDDAGYFDTTDKVLIEMRLKNISRELGFPVMVLVTDDVGPDKSDYGVMDYADVYQEGIIGIDKDGIMYMINLDPLSKTTGYDRITTSGDCIRRFTDNEIEYIFDAMWDNMLAERFSDGITDYIAAVKKYSGYNYDSGSGYSGGDSYYGGRRGSGNIIFALLVINVVIIIGFITGVKKTYKIARAKGAANYLKQSSVNYYQKSDTYIRTFVTKTYIQRSSGGGGHHGGSSHRSSGGGHHGGGGRSR